MGVDLGVPTIASALGKKCSLKIFLSTVWTDKAVQYLREHFFWTLGAVVLVTHFG